MVILEILKFFLILVGYAIAAVAAAYIGVTLGLTISFFIYRGFYSLLETIETFYMKLFRRK